jgi:hypothetical protein
MHVKERTYPDPERLIKAIAYLNAKLDQETAHRSPGTSSGLSMHTSMCLHIIHHGVLPYMQVHELLNACTFALLCCAHPLHNFSHL